MEKSEEKMKTEASVDNGSTEKSSEARRAHRRSVPFFAVLALLTVVAWILPLRPEVSESEKRRLKEFPTFSTEALLDGSYFAGIDDWFSDTFPFRESWITAAREFKSAYGLQTVAISGEIQASDAVPVPVKPAEPDEPETEPAIAPTAEPETAAAEAPEDEDLPEEIPEEDVWGGDIVGDDDFVSVSAILQIGDSAYKITSFSQYYADSYIQSINTLAEKLDGKANIYCMIVPENTTFMLSREDRERFNCTPEEDVLDYFYGSMDERIKAVNVIENVQAHNDEYVAFHTDHHWTALGAYYAYEVWCEAAGVTPVPLSEYTEYEWENFHGTYYYRANRPSLLQIDTVHAFDPPGDVHMYLAGNNNDSLGAENSVLIDMSKNRKEGAQYMTFIGSDSMRATFVNNDITDGSACMVIKTSVGNPFVYYLTQHYQYVYVVDGRYYGYHSIPRFVELFDIDDVIFAHGTGFAESKGGASLMKSLVGR